MSKLLHFLTRQINYIRKSIAFYPSLIATLLASLAILFIYLESTHITQKIANKLPVLIIQDPDTARSILNTLIGGIISLMVFSFSMVMVILNQASSNYSPRLLPGLITNKRHQIVLGIYLGSILFCILCSINVLPKEDSYSIPSLTILMSIILGVTSLGMFIYFIHSISESIQISKIINSLYIDGNKHIEKLLDTSKGTLAFTQPLEHQIKSDKSGYLVSLAIESLKKLTQKHNIQLELLKPLGLFIFEKEAIFACSHPLNKDLEEQILNCFQCSDNEVLHASHFTSIKSINEVALKAMSPGINDPGTALIAINYLFLLFSKRMQLADIIYHSGEDQKVHIRERLLLFEKLLYSCFAELRTYAAHDPVIVERILDGFDYLLQQTAAEDHFYRCILQEKKSMIEHSKALFKINYDQSAVLSKKDA